MTDHPDRVTLEQLAAADYAVTRLERRLAAAGDELARAVEDLQAATWHRQGLLARYREQAARPLVEP